MLKSFQAKYLLQVDGVTIAEDGVYDRFTYCYCSLLARPTPSPSKEGMLLDTIKLEYLLGKLMSAEIALSQVLTIS